MMHLSSWAITHRGQRSENEDSVLIPVQLASHDGVVMSSRVELGRDGLLCAVADGVGGRAGGAWASGTAIETMRERRFPANTENSLAEGIRFAHERIQMSSAVGAATTIAGVSCSLDRTIIFNVGDTRVYRLDVDEARIISVDHLSRTDGRSITRFLGGHLAQTIPHVVVAETKNKDRYLICSDGLYAFVRPVDLLLAAEIDPESALIALVNLAMDNGSPDNVSAVYCCIDQ